MRKAKILISRLSYIILVVANVAALLSTKGLAAQPSEQPGTQPVNQATTPVSGSAIQEAGLPEPQLIESLMKQQFKVVKPPASVNPFPILVPLANKEKEADPRVSQYEVLAVQPFDDKGFFRHQKVFLVIINKIILERRIMTGHRSNGLFALDGKLLTYLHGATSAVNVSKVLRRENRSLSDADPLMLSTFFASTILRQNNDRVDVVISADDILKQDRPNPAIVNKKLREKGLGRSYATTLDKAKIEKCKGRLIQPQISYNSKSGWTCKFIGLRGYLHTIRVPFALLEYNISVSPSFDIKIEEHILSDKLLT